MRWLCGTLVFCTLTAAAQAADFVWMEGEKPSRKNYPCGPAGVEKTQFLSQGAWLSVSLDAAKIARECPKEGVLLDYDFEITAAGEYEVWNRVGMEFVRTAFEWRIDQSAWQTVGPQDLTCDLMEVGLWNEVAWFQMGQQDLAPGSHTLQIRLKPAMKEENGKKVVDKILYCSDALCLYKGHFRPNGKFKPDADWRTDDDKKATAQIFEMPDTARAETYAAADAAAPAERIEVPLAGLWQVCRFDEQQVVDRTGPTRTLPDARTAYWMSIQVPGDKFEVKPELTFCHRFAYRTRVRVPAKLAGRSFYLRFPSIDMIASLHVNGQFCGWTRAMNALWECDVTRAMRPGQVNEICVVLKDCYYAVSEKKLGKSCRMMFNTPPSFMVKNWCGMYFDFPVANELAAKAGILEAPSLIAAGMVYATDVFAKPSVKNQTLVLEVSVLNPTASDQRVRVLNEIVPAAGGKAEKRFAPQELAIPPGREVTLKLSEPWQDPKLWWPDAPNLCHAITTIECGGKVIDKRRTPFGFRQWEWDGPRFKLNGVPWSLWADCTANDGGKDPEAAIALWRRNGNNTWRFWGDRFGGLDRQKALDLMDARGIIVRRTGIFDGQGGNYLHGLVEQTTVNGKQVTVGFKDLYDHWIEQLQAQVKSERNHPSILVWSIENEITFINSRNWGLSQYVEPEVARAARAVMELDPTRPAMVDGGNCLVDESLPVNGVHYQEAYWRDYPDEAYTLEKALAAHTKPVLGWGKVPWRLVPDRPIFMGESFFARGSAPGEYSQLAGEGCFTGWGEQTRLGVGRLAKMLAEGYRWHGVAAFHFWFGEDEARLHYNSFKPVCVFAREWNWTFGDGVEVPRTLKVFNDTRQADPIEVAWQVSVDGKPAGAERRVFQLEPGQHREFSIVLRTPKVSRRTPGELILTCRRGGKEVFREVKPLAVLPTDGGPKPSLSAGQLAVLDPLGTTKDRLTARGIALTEVQKLDEIPAEARAVVVGKDALSARDATDPRWLALASRGVRVLMLEQAHPLHYLALPADLTPTDFAGRVAFLENPAHPVFEGLDQPDFFTWSGDHVVYRNAYRKATRGAVSLAHCDERLGCSAIAECPVSDGLLLLCQMVVGEKLAKDPVAQRLFDNMLAYCERYVLVQKHTAVVMDAASPALTLLADSGLKFDRVGDVLAAMADGKHQIVVFDATAANLKALADSGDAIKAFTAKGGWLMPWGVTPAGLADFNRIVGVEHVLRPFELERVNMPAVRDPILSGLTVRDVTMESAEQIFPWAGDKYLVEDEFTYVVDLDDIAPFCEFPGAKAGDVAAAKAAGAGWSRNMVNGFTSADAWKLIHYMTLPDTKVTLRLPREETIDAVSIVLNTHYAVATKVQLYFGDDPKPVVLSTKPNGERQEFAIEPRKCRRLAIRLAEFNKPGKTTGVDNIWIHVQRPADWPQRVRPLLNIGALVKYPMGEGGVILNQVRAKPSEAVPVNVQKKQTIVATLLRNLHAAFAGSRLLTTANLKFQPIPLDDECNQYLTKDRGWFAGGRDLAHVPAGTNLLGGVAYTVRDFRTSPVPSCIMLAGPGARGQLPEEVRGLKIDAKADALFFLHTFLRADEWRPSKPEDAPPMVFRYVVHYADGQTAEVPVLYGEGVDHWLAKEPKGLKSASVAWAAPAPGDTSGEQAVLYQFSWTNPRPTVPIASIDMLYGQQGSRYGTPALLGITAATETK